LFAKKNTSPKKFASILRKVVRLKRRKLLRQGQQVFEWLLRDQILIGKKAVLFNIVLLRVVQFSWNNLEKKL
jgi:hypothetical protein